jgi:hypothetical protein
MGAADRGDETRYGPWGYVASDVAGPCPLRRLVAGAVACFTDAVVLYGIASSLSQDIDDLYATAEDAQAVLRRIFLDEPQLEGALWVERLEFELSPN